MPQKRYAYLIGANGPKHQNIISLQYAEKDVEHLQRALSDHPCEFTDVKSAIATNPLDVLIGLERLATSCERSDLLIVHFSGHGKVWGGNLYLICNETEIDARLFEATAINISRLKTILDLCNAKHKLLVLDCCHAGTAHAGGTWRGEQELETALQDIKGSVSAILSACAAHKPTRELDTLELYLEKGAGFLSWALAAACSEHFANVSREGALSLSDILSWLPEVRDKINLDLRSDEQVPLPRLLSERDIAGDDEIWLTGRRRRYAHGVALEERQQREEHMLHNQEPFLRQYCLGAEIEDFEEEKVRAFAQKQQSFSRLPLGNIIELCKRLGLASSVGTPRRLAVLAFHNVPNRYISPAVIRVTLRTLENDIYSRDTIEGPLGEQVEKAVQWLISNLRTIREDAKVGQRTDRCEIPQKALQELVVNAVLHRDYEAKESVQIKITPKQIIITNPGRLNSAILVSNSPFSYRESHPRNPELLDVLIAQRWAEGIGHGFEIITEEFQKYHLPLPNIENLPGGLVRVLIQRPDIISISAEPGGIGAYSIASTSISMSELYPPPRQWLPPAPLSLFKPFIGREMELEYLRALIGDENSDITLITGKRKMVAIQGMGGIGKTYLARKLAMELHDFFAGVIWINFGPQVTDEASTQVLLSRIASYAFGGFPLMGQLSPEVVAAWLEDTAPGRLLVIFDDVWHPRPLRLLSQALPTSAVCLVTTRSANVVQAIEGRMVVLDRLSLSDGLALLEDRLHCHNDIRYRDNLEALVKLLDGHALALEIAAALIRKPSRTQAMLHSLQQDIGRGILDRLELFPSEDGSLERSLALSYEHMTPELRRHFRTLGVFAAEAPITTEAAAAVWSMESLDNVRKALFDLVNLALLTEIEDLTSTEPSYHQHSLLHGYAYALLVEMSELPSACHAHAQYYTDMSWHAVTATPVNRPLLDRHIQNLLGALQWTVDNEPLMFSRLLEAIADFLLLRGQSVLLEIYLPKAVQVASGTGNNVQQASLLRSLGDLECRLGNIDVARAHYDAALPLCRAERDRLGEANLLRSLGDLERRLGNIDVARTHYDAALPLYRAERDRLGEAHLLQSLGDLEGRLGNIDQARAYYDAALPLCRAERDRLGEANLLRSLGDLERRLGNIDVARTHYDAALPLYRAERDRLGEANLLTSLGDLECRLDKFDEARKFYDTALPLYRMEQTRLGEANLLLHLGDLERQLGNFSQARIYYEEILPLYRYVGNRWGEANVLGAIADTQLFFQETEAALQSYEQALALYRQVGDWLGEANCYLAQGRVALEQKDLQRALALHTDAYQIYRQLQDAYSQVRSLYYRSFVYETMSKLALALQDAENALATARMLGLPSLEFLEQRLNMLREVVVPSSAREYVFISYSHKDRPWLEKLLIMLTPLVRRDFIEIWSDTQIEAGAEWQKEISKALAHAKIAVLLVTPNFLASDFIAKHELPPLLKAAEKEGLSILWIAIGASLYTETEVAAYQSVNDPSRPLEGLNATQLNKALVQICKTIEQAANR
jgi:tetratricopeptide (TPR) repeat protein